MDFARVVGLQVLHELGNPPFLQRFEDKVYMVGHEAKGMHADAVAASEAIEMVEVVDELGARPEDGLLAATTLIDVVDLAHVEITLAGWGGFVTFGSEFRHLLNSVFWKTKFSHIFKESCGNSPPTLRQ